MIKSVTLKNWRSHLNSYIEFSKGTNIIVGRMGGGKSSVIDGICFALFGTTPAVQHRRLKITDFIKNRPKEENEAEVRLVFEHKGEEFLVIRKIKRKGGSEAEIKKNGQRLEGPQSERVSEYIRNMLEIDYDLFTRAIYSEQNRIDYFLTLGRGERKKQIDELIGIDRFEIARKNSTTAISRIKTMKSDKETFIKNADLSQIENEIKEFERQLNEIKNEKEKFDSEFQKISIEKNEKEKAINEMKLQREKFRKIQDEVTGFKHNLELIKKDVESSTIKDDIAQIEKKMEERKNRKENLQKELNSIDNEYRETAKSLAIVKSNIQNIEKKKTVKKELEIKIKTLLENETLETFKENVKTLEEESSRKMENLSDCKAKISELDRSITELKNAYSQCPVCDSELDMEKRERLIKLKEKNIDEHKKTALKLTKELDEIATLIRKLKERVDGIERTKNIMKEYDGLEADEVINNKNLSEIDVKLKDIVVKKENINKELNAVSNEYLELSKLYENIKELQLKKAKIAKIEKDLLIKEKELSEIAFNDHLWDTINKEMSDLSVKYAQLKSKIEQSEERETYVSKLLSDKRKRLNEIKKYSKEIEDYNELISSLQLFSNAVVETQHDLREELIDSVNQALSEIWRKLYPYSDYTMIKLVPSENDYDLMFKINDEYVGVDGIASGGERALACLALRVAFAMVLTPNLSWLILDEPTHNLDEEAVRTLAETLREHIPQIVEQTFVITHDEQMKEAASGKLVRIQRDNNFPENSRIDELSEIVVPTPTI